MKKYLTVSIALILCVVGWIFISSRFSLYVHLGGEEQIKAEPFQIKGKEIYRITDGNRERFEIRGVNLSSFLPGRFVTDYAVSKRQYQEWFALIQELGANTIRIPTIYDNGFYDALYQYNTKQEEQGGEPLYLLQALWVTDYAQNSREDAYSNAFFGQLQLDIKNAVDVIHGNTLLPYAKVRGSGWYRFDVSDWVVGFTLGTTWQGSASAYTNQMQQKPLYNGKWFCAAPKASQFENMLANLLDILVDYESTKYGQQHLVSITSEPTTDPFDYTGLIEIQLEKYDRIDAEHIRPQETVLSGFFVSYKLYHFCPDILDYLTQAEQKRLSGILTDIPREGSFGGYLELLQRYYSVPVIAGDCGYSTSRGLTGKADSNIQIRTKDSAQQTTSHGLTEEAQGQALVELYQECKRAGLSGMLISDWQDNWSQTDWNIYPMTDKEQEPLWHNVQSKAQGYGLLTFEPGEEPLVTVDGDPSEWAGTTPLISNDWGNLSVRQDVTYLYLYLENTSGSNNSPERIYIPIDVTPKSGSKRYKSEDVSFEREADFLLYLDNENQGRLLVQDYYDPWRAAWNQRIAHIDAYTIDVPAKNSENFVPLRMVLESLPTNSVNWNQRYAATADTGELRFGIADPQNPAYDSQADFYTSGTCTEIRIPWALLNFQAPPSGMVHDDYYQHYGIQGQNVKEIYLGFGVGRNSRTILMKPFPLRHWGRDITYRQRLKQSYDIVQNCWRHKQNGSN